MIRGKCNESQLGCEHCTNYDLFSILSKAFRLFVWVTIPIRNYNWWIV